MKMWKVWSLFFCIFLSGFFLGIIGTKMKMIYTLKNARISPIHMRETIVHQLVDILNLDPEQQVRFNKIAQSNHRKLYELRLKNEPEFTNILLSMKNEVVDILKPSQKNIFFKLFPEEFIHSWQEGLKNSTNELSSPKD